MAHLPAPRFVLGMLLLAVLACGPTLPNPSSIAGTAAAAAANTALAAVGSGLGPPLAFTPGPTPDWSPDTYLPARIQQGALKLDSATIPGSGTDFYGPILSLQVTNPGTQEVLTTIPCGLIFEPDKTTLQRLMVVQAFSATVSAGGSAELKPYVVCIDDSKHAPATNATYKIGTLAGGDLLKLAACVCTQPLSVNTDLELKFGLQFAVWTVSDKDFPGNLTDSPLGPQIQPFLRVGLGIANGWLKSCGVSAIQ
jgi:hypothetical protein